MTEQNVPLTSDRDKMLEDIAKVVKYLNKLTDKYEEMAVAAEKGSATFIALVWAVGQDIRNILRHYGNTEAVSRIVKALEDED